MPTVSEIQQLNRIEESLERIAKALERIAAMHGTVK